MHSDTIAWDLLKFLPESLYPSSGSSNPLPLLVPIA